MFVVVRASAVTEQPALARLNLPNTNTVRECLFAPLRCLFARRDLLFVCSAFRDGADAMREEGHLRPPAPKIECASWRAEVLRAKNKNRSVWLYKKYVEEISAGAARPY